MLELTVVASSAGIMLAPEADQHWPHAQEASKMSDQQEQGDSTEMVSARDEIALAKEQGKISTRTVWQSILEARAY